MSKVYVDERTKAEKNSINLVMLPLFTVITACSLAIKSFFLELTFFNYGIELCILGLSVAYFIAVAVCFMPSKRLDERTKAFLGKVGNIYNFAVYLAMIVIMLVSLFVDPDHSTISLYPSICTIVSGLFRVFATKSIPQQAVEADYATYKKSVIKVSAIVASVVFVISLALVIISFAAKSTILLIVGIAVFWVSLATIVLYAILYLRAKKIYDKTVS